MDLLEKKGGCCHSSTEKDCSNCQSECRQNGNCANSDGGGGKCCSSNHSGCFACSYHTDKKLNVFDWLQDIPESSDDCDFIEVQFKNTRKGYYKNSNKIKLLKGDIVAVESNPGHDIGEVTLTGRLVLLQMKKNNVRTDNPDIRRVYRKAKPNDLEKYEEAKSREHATMLKARKIAEDLNLNMKIGDVEYQGDGNKAIFYYIADDRVDFRQLIKVLAENFRVRIEMKQIGARQEAGRIGGIGPCGRELCCSGWMTSFVSVATSAARYQDISLNPQKLAGQCAKLKCCLNYEVDTYVEAQKQLPSREMVLSTKDADFYHFKTDIHKRMISYSTSRDFAANLVTISASRAFEIIALNKRGIRVDTIEGEAKKENAAKEFSDVVGQDSLTRFDKNKKNQNKKRKKGPSENGAPERQDAPREERPRRDDRGPRNNRFNKADRLVKKDETNAPVEENQTRPERNNRPNRTERKNREEHPRKDDRENSPNEQRTLNSENKDQQPQERKANRDNRPRSDRQQKSNADQKERNNDSNKTSEAQPMNPEAAKHSNDATQGENPDRRPHKKGPRRHPRFDKKKGNTNNSNQAPTNEQ